MSLPPCCGLPAKPKNRSAASILRLVSMRRRETLCRPLDQEHGVIDSDLGECGLEPRPGTSGQAVDDATTGVSRVTGFRLANGSNGSIREVADRPKADAQLVAELPLRRNRS